MLKKMSAKSKRASSTDSDSSAESRTERAMITEDNKKKKKMKKPDTPNTGGSVKAISTNTVDTLTAPAPAKPQTENNKTCCAHGNNTCLPSFRVAKTSVMYEDPSMIRPCNLCAMTWSDYHRLETIYRHMEALVQDYPCICCIIVIGRSVEGRELRVLKISNGSKNNTSVWMDGAIHAREWISSAVVTYIADQLARNFFNLSPEITSKDWYMLPVMNPDGYEFSFTNDRMWRKNRVCHGETIGVDLNRNFSVGWDVPDLENDTEYPGSIYFRGPVPFSEPETAAVRDFVIDINHDKPIQVFISFHSYGDVILFPWGYCKEPCPDYVKMLQGATIMAKAIFDETGNTYKVGSTKDLMYFATGTNIDWCYREVKIPFCYMVELPGRTHRFSLPREDILCTCIELWSGVLSTVEFADHVSRQCNSVAPACFEKESSSCKRPICVAHSTSSVSFKGKKIKTDGLYSVTNLGKTIKENRSDTTFTEDNNDERRSKMYEMQNQMEPSNYGKENDRKHPMKYEQNIYTSSDNRHYSKMKAYAKPEETITETDSYDSYYSGN